jgi:hypothetical protein
MSNRLNEDERAAGRQELLVSAIGVEWLILFWMMKRRIFVKAKS